jgi:hypothetical protein
MLRGARCEEATAMSEAGDKDQASGASKPASASEAARQAAQREHLDERLDEALDETFPASDPIAVHEPRKDPPPR